MKYKKIILDKTINKRIRRQNVAEVARQMGVSKTYMYKVLKEDHAVNEEFYLGLLDVLEEMEIEYSCCDVELDDTRICASCKEPC